MIHPKKYVLITGCSSGIGHCVAHGLAQRNYQVIATVRNETDKNALQHPNIHPLIADLQDSKSIDAAVSQALELSKGQIDVLFNNAGFGQPGAVEDLQREVIRQQFETNVFGALELTNKIIPSMRQQGQGRILFNSSVLGFVCIPFRGAYNASKYALEALADTLRLELHGTNIRVILIEPGPITSRFRENALHAFKQKINPHNSAFSDYYQRVLGRLESKGKGSTFTLPPEAVLKRVIHAIESPRPKIRYYITLPTYLFAACKRLLPFTVQDWLIRQVERLENKQK